jgi:hypothetical protein
VSSENHLRTFASDISDLVESARGVKGEQFITAANAIFECVQVATIATRLGDRLADSGVNVLPTTNSMSLVALSASARIASMLGGSDAQEAIDLARRMMERRDRVELALNAESASNDGRKQ